MNVCVLIYSVHMCIFFFPMNDPQVQMKDPQKNINLMIQF